MIPSSILLRSHMQYSLRAPISINVMLPSEIWFIIVVFVSRHWCSRSDMPPLLLKWYCLHFVTLSYNYCPMSTLYSLSTFIAHRCRPILHYSDTYCLHAQLYWHNCSTYCSIVSLSSFYIVMWYFAALWCGFGCSLFVFEPLLAHDRLAFSLGTPTQFSFNHGF